MSNANTASVTTRWRFARSHTASEALELFERLVRHFPFEPHEWGATGVGQPNRSGGFQELRGYVAKHERATESFNVGLGKRIATASCHAGERWWSAAVSVFDADTGMLIRHAIPALRDASSVASTTDGSVSRQQPGTLELAPHPPLAQGNYAALVTDAEVNAAYDDAPVFWNAWDSIESLGRFKLCTRALDELDEELWLGKTFEKTMAMVRAAKPNLTKFPAVQLTGIEGPWWEYGDVQDEKAGWPLLERVTYDTATKTLEFAANPGGDGHVLLQELQTLKRTIAEGKTHDGKPLDAVRVVFRSEAQARTEKRPLLDIGAKVYYLGADGDLVELSV